MRWKQVQTSLITLGFGTKLTKLTNYEMKNFLQFFQNYNAWKFIKMIKDKFGQYIYNENDVLDLVMREIDIEHTNLLVTELDTKQLNNAFGTITTTEYTEPTETLSEFDTNNQKNWYMPDDYKQLDIAEYVLSLCTTQEELQRCGVELLMYQDRNLFNLLRYLKYLVDTMKENNIIWGVGRGSSVSSYILYKMEVHKVDSMFYNLDVGEFLR